MCVKGRDASASLSMHSACFVVPVSAGEPLVATGASDGRVYLWSRGGCVGVFRADEGAVLSLACLGGALFTGSASGIVRKFSIAGFALLKTFALRDETRRAVIEHDLSLQEQRFGLWGRDKGEGGGDFDFDFSGPSARGQARGQARADAVPAGTPSHPQLRAALARSAGRTARFGVAHLVVTGLSSATIFVGTKLGELFAFPEVRREQT